jgi:non-canonical purine NTP pyrophosphatase (RdgB/HAM1 family)
VATDRVALVLSKATLVTGNPGKLEEARRLCGVEMKASTLDLPEVQSLAIEEVLRAKAHTAFGQLQTPIVVDETGLELAALNGFPGCLVKWMLEAVGADGVARTAHSLGDPRATARCALLYFDGRQEVLAEGTTAGSLVMPPRGTGGFAWDPIFRPDGYELTFAELSGPAKDAISHRGAAWHQLTILLRDF